MGNVESATTLGIYPAKKTPTLRDRESKYSGEIVFATPEVNPVTGQIRVWAEADNIDGLLRPGVKGCLRVGSSPIYYLRHKVQNPDNT